MQKESRAVTGNRDGLVTPSLGLLVLLVACLGVPVAVFVLVVSPPPAELDWDIANALGYMAAGMFLVLFIYSGQRRSFPPFSGRFFIRLHHHLGYAVLLLVTLHVGVLLVREPILIEHLKISAPGYMLAGLAAAILVGLITLASVQVIRRKLWKNYTLFRFIHAFTGIGIVAFTAWHIIGSAWYANQSWKLSAWILATVVVCLVYLGGKYRRPAFDIPPTHRARRPAALISYLATVILCCIAIVLALALQE
jgi:hypothetical protein